MNSIVKKPGMGTQKERLIKLTQHPHDGLQPPVTTPVPGDPTPSSDLCKYQAHTWYTKQLVYVEKERKTRTGVCARHCIMVWACNLSTREDRGRRIPPASWQASL